MLRLLAFVEAATVTGPARNLLDFCRAVKTIGLPVDIHLATFSRTGDRNEFTDAVGEAGIPLTVIREKRSFDFGVTSAMAQVILRLKPDILQTHAVKSHFLMSMTGVPKGSKWIAFHHGYTTTDTKMRLYNQLDRWSLRKPARLVTVSRAFERQLVNSGVAPGRISVLQNAIGPGWTERVRQVDRAALRRELGLGLEDNVILAVGRMSVEKAHADLISAIHLLRKELPRTHLVLVGDGPERAHLETIAGDAVRFIGQTSDVAPYFAIANVMALPSLTEGSPNVLLEAMACGVPSVATTVGGIPEMVSNGESALLVPPRDPAKMAAALRRVLCEQVLRESLTQGALELIRRKHSVEARAQTLWEIYSAIHKAAA